jgi:hypothetical protein
MSVVHQLRVVTGTALPARAVVNRDLIAEAFPDLDEAQRRRLEDRRSREKYTQHGHSWRRFGDPAVARGDRADI